MTIEERLERLEQVNRRWRTVALAMGLVVLAGVLMAQVGFGVATDIRTRRLEVLNKKGVPVVTLDSTAHGGRISAASPNGNLLFEARDGQLSLYNGQGQKLARISTTKDGQGAVATYNHNGEGVVVIGATQDGRGAITTYNGEGQKLVSLSTAYGGGAISVRNNIGQVISTMQTDKDGNGEVGAWNQDGKGRKLTPGL